MATLMLEARRLLSESRRLRGTAPAPVLDRLRADPSRIMAAAGMTPDPWQTALLRTSPPRSLLLCSRQSGKSTSAAAMALREALLKPNALVLLLSPTLRQSGELFRARVRRLYSKLGRPIACVQESQLTMELANGSRIISLPGEEETIRGYSDVSLLVIDEAARVPDALYYSVRPMLAVSRGMLVVMSTPFGKRGWFYEAWSGSESWNRVSIKATDCPRIGAKFLEEERATLGEHWYQQEYENAFRDVVDAFFRQSDIDAAVDNDLTPLFVD